VRNHLSQRTFRFTARRVISAILLAICARGLMGQSGGDPLKAGFQNPPASARPRVWWHWMNGNITKEGIKLDLEWMHRIGLGGFQAFDAQLSTPQVVKQRLVYMTPEWKDAFRYAITLGDQVGFEAGIAGSPGWSETGGPWVPASEAMKKYAWSEITVEGGTPFKGQLPHPPTASGAFQDLDIEHGQPGDQRKLPRYYADSAVIAYRIPDNEVAIESLQPKITWSAGQLDPKLLSDGQLTTETSLEEPPAGEHAWVQYEFPQVTTIRSLTIAMGSRNRYEDIRQRLSSETGITLEVGSDGSDFRQVMEVPKGGAAEHTLTFPPATGKLFRVIFKTLPDPPASALSNVDPAAMPQPSKFVQISELELHTDARVNRFEDKAAFGWYSVFAPDLYSCATMPVSPRDEIRRSDVIDLTGKMHADGTLDWTPPVGRWKILRLGYSLLGITNHPATAEATGLEVDKLNATDVRHYMDNYLASFEQTVGPGLMGHRGIQAVVTDSWEAGPQNWTDDMIQEFTRRRGYSPIPWLPILAGHIVQSAEASDQFLWDFRKTIADLTADEHYGQVEASLKQRGLLHYGESHEEGRAFIADGMEVKKLDDVPMSAMWVQWPGINKVTYDFNADDRESASVAHIYGQNLAAAESMTSSNAPWAWSPATLKPTADMEFLNGINRFVIHESAHQPLVGPGTAPGLTLGPHGQWFNRNETWAEEAKPWVDYLARSSYLLQQGHFVADVLYFYGEDSNLTRIFESKSPDSLAGAEFDYINADALIHELSVANGRIVTKSGMSYRVLYLDPYSGHMSLPVLRAIGELVEQGAMVAGQKPFDDPSLADDHAKFNRLDRVLFGDGSGVHNVGKGRVFAGQTIRQAFTALNVQPDFAYSAHSNGDEIQFVHRKLQDADIYFLDNRSDHNQSIDASFRVTGRTPELWYAESGTSKTVSYRMADGRTTVPLQLEPWGTVFVVFRHPTRRASLTLPEINEKIVNTIAGPWTLEFMPVRDAPSPTTLQTLSSWTENPNPGIRYYSGTGTYRNAIDAQQEWFTPGAHLWLDLGDVKNLAHVSLNGKDLGVVWHAPFRFDVTEILKPGRNELTVQVVNAWVNRMIGDQQPGATQYTYADIHPYKADSPLKPSGLLGPVEIVSANPAGVKRVTDRHDGVSP
jgi:hypothetical protein